MLDLSKNEFRNNLWHQCSQIFTADEDCDDVTISVVNLNNRPLTIGNDFGLDDIQFHPISSVSLIVKSYQEFQVYAHEPKVDAFTALVVPIDCDGAPNYTVKMHVEYQNPDGDLTIHDKTTDTYYTYTLPPVKSTTPRLSSIRLSLSLVWCPPIMSGKPISKIGQQPSVLLPPRRPLFRHPTRSISTLLLSYAV